MNKIHKTAIIGNKEARVTTPKPPPSELPLDTIRQTLCKSRFLSPRNLDRFKNSLIWQIQLKRYVTFPKNMTRVRLLGVMVVIQ